jgi:hypothetical protein
MVLRCGGRGAPWKLLAATWSLIRWRPQCHTAICGRPQVDGFAPWMSAGFFQRVSDSVALNKILGVNRIEPFRGPMPSLPGVAGPVGLAFEGAHE